MPELFDWQSSSYDGPREQGVEVLAELLRRPDTTPAVALAAAAHYIDAYALHAKMPLDQVGRMRCASMLTEALKAADQVTAWAPPKVVPVYDPDADIAGLSSAEIRAAEALQRVRHHESVRSSRRRAR